MKMSLAEVRKLGKIRRELEDIAVQCVEYVGYANYPHRENHARFVLRKAFRDASRGKIPTWFEEKDEDG